MIFNTKKPIVITAGEPAGVGPDLIVKIAQKNWPIKIVICGSPDVLLARAKKLQLPLFLHEYNKKNFYTFKQNKGNLMILPIYTIKPVEIGKLCVENSLYVLNILKIACKKCLTGEFSGLVTTPVHKGIINKFGNNFIGHTEFFSMQSHVKDTIMLFVADDIKLALVTKHIPLKNVSKTLTKSLLIKTIILLHNELKKNFGILHPSILVCGLNPHAGELGYIGNEEIDIIIPVIKKLRKNGIKILGPISADTIFQKKYLKLADVILSMYHDQSLPVLKYKYFCNSVNITLGLPFIRTSVDHGTAIELAGTKNVNINSFIKAIKMLITMIKNEK